ncbi:S1C family serine protease [Fusibacter sp. 3D3]|uniref:serine protease HtrA n=1 Tax=Fusibacter sp. 3D3 TaxID=1048380 RepID=UPI00085897C4|nr:trypsin-like peptidase domain-containing protein [Fusibacter sp. 3D3]GAU78338.1 serine protease [Fusibacter sp. 3D3]
MRQDESKKYFMIKKSLVLFLVFMLPLSAFMGGILGAGFVTKSEPQGASVVTDLNLTPMKVSSIALEGGIPAVAKTAMPSVVGVATTSIHEDWYYGTYKGESVGTGVIVDERGYILTNSHVVNDGNAEAVKVLLYDGTSKNAEILWNDAVLDLAVLKIEGKNLPVASLGNSDDIVVGETAIAIGNPLGLTFERSVTAGIISGLERTIPVNENYNIEGLVQTDASINPGNSGGPLLNIKGEVIGINTAKVQSGEGLGFAIPINIAKPIVDEFIMKGEFTKVYLGIKGVNVYQYIRTYGNDLGTETGVYVYDVVSDSPANYGGIISGDVIVSIGDTPINTITKLTRQLYSYRPDDVVHVKVIREGKPVDLKVILKGEPR